MSEKYSDCEIVLDLLPLYLDGKTGEESNKYVREHLTICPGCRNVYKMMSMEFPPISKKEQKHETKKKFWVKLKRHFPHLRKDIVILTTFLILYVLILVGIVMWVGYSLTVHVF